MAYIFEPERPIPNSPPGGTIWKTTQDASGSIWIVHGTATWQNLVAGGASGDWSGLNGIQFGPDDVPSSGDAGNTHFAIAANTGSGAMIGFAVHSGGDEGWWTRLITPQYTRDAGAIEHNTNFGSVGREMDVVAHRGGFSTAIRALRGGAGSAGVDKRRWAPTVPEWDYVSDDGASVIYDPDDPVNDFISADQLSNRSIRSMTAIDDTFNESMQYLMGVTSSFLSTTFKYTYWCETSGYFESVSGLFHVSTDDASDINWHNKGNNKISVNPLVSGSVILSVPEINYESGDVGVVQLNLWERTGLRTWSLKETIAQLHGTTDLHTLWNSENLGFHHAFDDFGNEHVTYSDFDASIGTGVADIRVFYQTRDAGESEWEPRVQVSGLESATDADQSRTPGFVTPLGNTDALPIRIFWWNQQANRVYWNQGIQSGQTPGDPQPDPSGNSIPEPFSNIPETFGTIRPLVHLPQERKRYPISSMSFIDAMDGIYLELATVLGSRDSHDNILTSGDILDYSSNLSDYGYNQFRNTNEPLNEFSPPVFGLRSDAISSEGTVSSSMKDSRFKIKSV